MAIQLSSYDDADVAMMAGWMVVLAFQQDQYECSIGSQPLRFLAAVDLFPSTCYGACNAIGIGGCRQRNAKLGGDCCDKSRAFVLIRRPGLK